MAGLGAGVIEAIAKAVDRLVLNHWIEHSADVYWLVVIADTLALLPLGLVLALIAWLWPVIATMRVVVVAAALPAMAMALEGFSLAAQVQTPAKVILATGFATAVARWLGPRPAATRYAPRILGAGLLVASLGGGLWHAQRALVERMTIAGLPAARSDAPNVLVIVLDTVRARNMSLYGYPLDTTPFLEQWARRGVTFDSAFSTSSGRSPAHASMFTGRFPDEMGADWLSARQDRSCAR